MLEIVPETGSTSGDLIARLSAGEWVGEGHWLVADRQTEGRGRLGREWYDGKGNYMGSTLVHVGQGDPDPASLSLVAGLAVHAAVSPHVRDKSKLFLKWPNDLIVGNAKLSGILLERTGDAVIVGVGVNLVVAPDVADRETVALAELGDAPDRDKFANELAGHFAAELERWRSSGLQQAIRRWISAAHPEGTALRVVDTGGDEVDGTFAGLDETGGLRLRLANGAVRVIHAGDVFLTNLPD